MSTVMWLDATALPSLQHPWYVVGMPNVGPFILMFKCPKLLKKLNVSGEAFLKVV